MSGIQGGSLKREIFLPFYRWEICWQWASPLERWRSRRTFERWEWGWVLVRQQRWAALRKNRIRSALLRSAKIRIRSALLRSRDQWDPLLRTSAPPLRQFFFYKPIFVDYNSTNWTRKMYDHSNRYKISRGIEWCHWQHPISDGWRLREKKSKNNFQNKTRNNKIEFIFTFKDMTSQY